MKSMREMISLMEGVMAVPGINEKSTSEKQARFMAAASHDPKFAKKVGMDQSVAKEFNKADTGTKQLSNAMKHKKTNEGSVMSGSDLDDSEVEVDESVPAIDSCNQNNPANADVACAMESHDENDMNFIRQAITQMYDYATSVDELRKMVAGETGYGDNPDFHHMFDMALDHFQNGDDSSFNHMDEPDDFTDYTMRQGEMGNPDRQMEEAYDLQNGYDDINDASGNDYFPNGADSPVVRATGPSGARQGDNPEQKKMQVAETHKELVYAYRNYLKETKK
jgi:hypothetical protein